MATSYKTANGRVVDMENLRLQNETVIAVGNMKVNARGDLLGEGGAIVQDRNQRVNEQYNLHTMVPVSAPVMTSSSPRIVADTIVPLTVAVAEPAEPVEPVTAAVPTKTSKK